MDNSGHGIERFDRLRARLHDIAFTRDIGGCKDEAALREAKDLCSQMQGCTPDENISYIIGEAEHWFEILFSTRRHELWGVEKVRSFVRSEMCKIDRALNRYRRDHSN